MRACLQALQQRPPTLLSRCALRDGRRCLATAATPPARQQQQQQQQTYRRKSSNPQTRRERGDFERDYKYSKRRPLPDVPWRQHKTCTYMDEAERLYGRMDTWHTVRDAAVRERLVALMQDYARDLVAALRLEVRDARRYRGLCDAAAREYRAHVVAAARGEVQPLRRWAIQLTSRPDRDDTTTTTTTNAADDDDDGVGEHANTARNATGNKRDDDDDKAAAAATAVREQRRQPRAAPDDGAVAVADLPATDARRRPPPSAFPFLRQRAVEHASTLDPSLVDWTAHHYPDDDAAMFTAPPQLRQASAEATTTTTTTTTRPHDDAVASHDGGNNDDNNNNHTDSNTTATKPAPRVPRLHARQRLQCTLRDHDDRHRATFDADGVFYHVKPPPRTTASSAAAAAATAAGAAVSGGHGIDAGVDEVARAPRPREVRGRDITAGVATRVVKVPWSVAALARKPGYSVDILRAKERLIRLSRGEDPATMP